MKRTLLGGLVLAMALMFGHVAASQAAAVQNITYDTYCDGASLSYDMFTGLASGTETGCYSGPMMGTVASIFSQGPALTMGYDATATLAGYVTVIRADHTWSHYQNTGAGISVLNSGTWSTGVARPNSTSGRSIGSGGR